LGTSAGLAAPDESPFQVTQPVRLTVGDATPTRTYSSPMIAVDPENENIVLAAYAEMRSARCGVARSTDGGRSWKRLEATPSLPSYPFCFTPAGTNVHQGQLAFGRNHTVYLALPGWDVQDGRNFSVLLARSTDLGDTWSTTIVRDARGRTPVETNRPVASIAVDTRGPEDTVYVGWPVFRMGFPTPMIGVSTDGGKTFGEPVSLIGDHFASEETRQAALLGRPTKAPPFETRPPTPPDQITAEKFGGCCSRVVLDDKGTVYALWPLATTIVPGPQPSHYLSRSTDGGKTFTVSQAVLPSATLGNVSIRWSPLGGPEGTLHLAYENKVPPLQGDRDVFHQSSADGGRTWTTPRMLNDDDPKLLAAQFMPNMNVAPNGRIDVAWWDFRNDTGAFRNDVYMASSGDNGRTWSPNIRVTNQSIDRKIGPWSNGYDVRQPVGLTATDRYTFAAWDDTRNGDADGEAQDLYGAFVQFEPLPPPVSHTWVYTLAAVSGLVLAGAVITVLGLVNRRRTRSPERAAEPALEPAEVT
ncbi:MAG: glycoside hydrolase, partial [Actinomycetota bacterium]|nr:glycoside hydrolase [Actinomycetota bacterium]